MPAPNLSALNKSASEVKRPVALNEGTYYGRIISHEIGESSKKKTLGVTYHVELTHAEDGVDLTGVDDKGNEVQLDPRGKKLRTTFWITDDSTYRLTDFIQSLGIETGDRSLKELVPQPVNQQVMVELTKEPNKDNTGYFNDIRSITGMANAEQTNIEAAQGRSRRRA